MRVAVIGAGGPAGVNVCRALHQAGHDVVGFDSNPWHLPWAEPWCAETVLSVDYVDALGVGADLVHAQPEQAVMWLSWLVDAPVFLPDPSVVALTQNKQETVQAWADAGLRERPVSVGEPLQDFLHIAREQFGPRFWLRPTRGAGARGSCLVDGDLSASYHWLRFWQQTEPELEWVAEEYLPGRDFNWTGVYHHGELLVSFARERLEWLYPFTTPTGRTPTPTVARVVVDDTVNMAAEAAVSAVDAQPHGVMTVDIRETLEGQPAPTEINAGRFPTTGPLYADLGVNVVDVYARASAGDVDRVGRDPYPAGAMLHRHIDCPAVFTAVKVAA